MDGIVKRLENHLGVKLDAHEKLICEALVSVGVLLNPANQDYELVAIGPVPAHVQEGFTRRGLQYYATLGVMPGFKLRYELAAPIADKTLALILIEWSWFVQRAMTQVENSASVSELYRMWDLKDERPN